jgi:hypothetical protein
MVNNGRVSYCVSGKKMEYHLREGGMGSDGKLIFLATPQSVTLWGFPPRVTPSNFLSLDHPNPQNPHYSQIANILQTSSKIIFPILICALHPTGIEDGRIRIFLRSILHTFSFFTINKH